MNRRRGLIMHSRLPAEYQEVEWIQNDGKSWLVTNIVPANDVGFKIKLHQQQDYSFNAIVAQWDTTTNDQVSGLRQRNGIWQCVYSGACAYIQTASFPITMECEFNWMASKKVKAIQNGATKTVDLGSFKSETFPYIIFAETPIGIWADGINKIYFLRFSKGNAIIADFVPCYRKSDNIIGMYDPVNGTFYTNRGSGNFTKGPNVYG